MNRQSSHPSRLGQRSVQRSVLFGWFQHRRSRRRGQSLILTVLLSALMVWPLVSMSAVTQPVLAESVLAQTAPAQTAPAQPAAAEATPDPGLSRSLGLPDFFFAPSSVETGWIQLRGVRLFQVTGYPASLAERRQRIHTNLKAISRKLLKPPAAPLNVDVRESNQSPVIYVNEQYLMTVTDADAQIQGLDSAAWAEQLRQTLLDNFTTLRLQHQPDYRRNQFRLLAGLFTALCVASLVLAQIEKALRRKPIGLLALGASLLMKRRSRLYQTRLHELQRLMLKTLQVSLWIAGGLFALSRFPQTRGLAFALTTALRVPVVIALALLGSYVLVRLVYLLVDRFSLAVSTNPLLPADASDRALQRVNTLSQVIKGLGALLISLFTFILSLVALGINIGPVLAGAGILGVGVSLASQGLIKDAINGFLIVLEDQYGVGDVIQIGEWIGLVESLNLRMTQLRNAEGQLITIPNSEIKIVANLSSQWARVDLNIPVPYEADLEAVMALIEKTAIALSQDPAWEALILEPPTLMGVEDFSERGPVIKLWIKTQPLKKVDVAREYRRRLKLAFDQADIHIPLSQRSIFLQPGEFLIDRPADRLTDSISKSG